jgi:A/G-specific adenine glycosylase
VRHKTISKTKSKSVKKRGVLVVPVAQKLSDWFGKNARVLPWREDSQPYYVWLSEVMLQQTQVTAVLPYFKKFIQKFPTVAALANASIDEVYLLWAGLGYYSRARNLYKGAQAIQARIDAGFDFPQSREDWLEIPGVGEYTAGAVCSIALNQREAIVDGNVVRVLSRVFAIGKLDTKKSLIWDRAREIVGVKSVEPRAVNQALMELGALVCKPKNPRCDECPISKECVGKKRPDLYPAPKPKKIWKQLKEEKWVLLYSDQVFLIQNKKSKWREGLWDFPTPNSLPLSKAKLIKEQITRYVVTNHKIERKHFVLGLTSKEAKKIAQHGTWFSDKELPGIPAPVKKFLSKL